MELGHGGVNDLFCKPVPILQQQIYVSRKSTELSTFPCMGVRIQLKLKRFFLI